MTTYLVYKIVTGILAVVILTMIAEQVSPRVAGILSGFPLGTGISLFFIGIENGAAFAAESAVYTMAGFSASLVFLLVYYLISSVVVRFSVVVSSVISIFIFLIVATGLQLVPFTQLSGGILSVSVVVGLSLFFRRIPNTEAPRPGRTRTAIMLIRAVFAAVAIVGVTGIAKISGPEWGGVLSAFPVTLFPFLVILHVSYGKQACHTIIKNYPMGLGSLIVYVAVLPYTYLRFGVPAGTALALLGSVAYSASAALWPGSKESCESS